LDDLFPDLGHPVEAEEDAVGRVRLSLPSPARQ
jgi:hypothetical protein